MPPGGDTLIQYVRLKAEADTSGIHDMRASMNMLDANVEHSAGLMDKLSATAKIVGVAAGAAVVAGIGSSIKTAADFQQSIANIAASTGATTEELKQLHDAALQVGKDTPKSASEAAAAFNELAKAGMSVKDIVGGAGRAVVDLAVASGKSVPEMATLVTSAQNAFGMTADQITEITNTLSAAAQASTLDVGDFQAAMQTGAATAKAAGMDLTDYASIIATLGNNGVQAAEGGTMLKSMLLALEAPSVAAQGWMDRLNIHMFDVNGNTRNMRDVLGDVAKAFTNLSDEEKAGASKDMFGSYGITAANILLKDNLSGWDNMREAMTKQMPLSEQTEKRMATLSGQIEQVKGSLETVAIKVGEKFLPGLTAAATGALGFVNSIIDNFPKIESTIGNVFDTVTSTLSPLGDFFGNLFSGDYSSAGEMFGGLAGAIGGVISNLPWPDIAQTFVEGLKQAGTIATGLASWFGEQIGSIDWQQVWSTTKDLGKRIGDGLILAFQTGTDLAIRLGTWIGNQISQIDWSAVWSNVSGFVESFGAFVDQQATPMGQKLNGMFNQLSSQGGGASLAAGLFKDIGDSLGSFIQGLGPSQAAIDNFTKALEPLMTALDRFLNEAIKPVAELIGGVLLVAFDGLLKILDGLGVNGSTMLTLITDAIKIFTDALNIVSDVVQIVVKLLTGDFAGAWDMTKQLVGDTVQYVIDMVKMWWDTISTPLENMASGISNIFSGIFDAVTGKMHDVWSWFTERAEDLTSAVTAPFKAVGKWIDDNIGSIFHKISEAGQGVWDWFSKHGDDIKGIVLKPFELARDGMAAIVNAMLEPVRKAIDGFNSLATGASSVVGWITQKVGLTNPLGDWKGIPNIDRFATGTTNFGGGLALVGELGPEIVFLPPGSSVMPTDASAQFAQQLGLPGFFGGIGDWLGDAGSFLKGIGGDALTTMLGWIGKGAEWLLNTAIDAIGFKLDFGSLFAQAGDLPGKVMGMAKDWLLDIIKQFLDTGKQSVAIAPSANGDLSPAQLAAGLRQAGLPEDQIATGVAILLAESGGNIGGVSGAGALGFAQFMPGTAAKWGVTPAQLVSRDPADIAAVFRAVVAEYRQNGWMPWDAYGYVAGNGPYGEAFVGYGNGSYRAFLPQTIGLAAGGTVPEEIIGIGRSGTFYNFGEGGKPETVIPAPLDDLTQLFGAIADSTEQTAHELIQQVSPSLLDVADATGGSNESLTKWLGGIYATGLEILRQMIDGITKLLDALQNIATSSRTTAAASSATAAQTSKNANDTTALVAQALRKLAPEPEQGINQPKDTKQIWIDGLGFVDVPSIPSGGGSTSKDTAPGRYGGSGPNFPRYASGGIVSSPQLAVVGDAASPELIAPLDYFMINLAEMMRKGFLQALLEVETQGASKSGAWTPFNFSMKAPTVISSTPSSTDSPSSSLGSSSSKGGMLGFFTPKSDGPGFDFIPLTAPGIVYGASGLSLYEPVAGIGLWSGNRYMMGEAGIEDVVPRGRAQGDTYVFQFGEGSVSIPAKDLAEMADVRDFFDRLKQTAKARMS